MSYHFFVHHEWFLQNLGKEAVRTNMHTTVASRRKRFLSRYRWVFTLSIQLLDAPKTLAIRRAENGAILGKFLMERPLGSFSVISLTVHNVRTYVIHSSSREGVDKKVCLQFYVKFCTIFSCEEKESPTKLQLS